MSFAWPHLLWLMLAPVFLLVWEITHRRRAAAIARPKILRAEAGARSLKLSAFETQTTKPGSRPRVWLCVGLVLSLGAMARPQWGRLEEPVFDQSREILLAIDLSRSMLTQDVRPSRLDRGKLLIQSLLEKLAGERVGLVVFAGTSFLQSPLSADYEILREFLPALGPDYLPQGGSNYGALLDAGLQAFTATYSADRFLVILSDGEATDEDWKSKIAELKKKNIRVLGLGIGTVGGAMIPDGAGGLVKDERGAVVLSKLESGTLQELARETGGVYRDASAWVDLAALVKETVEAGQKGQFVEKNTVRLVERFQWPLAFGLWCLFVSFCYEFPVRPRPRAIGVPPRATGHSEPAPKARSPVQAPTNAPKPAVAALVILALILGLGGFPGPVLVAATLATPPSGPAAPAATPPAPEVPPLAKIVGRLAAAERHTARDWAELGRETVTWGARLQTEKQSVPEGPVRDALAAVELGRKLDAKTTDWSKLKGELEALLKKPEQEEQKDEQNQQDQKDQQQNKDQKKQDQKSDQKKQDKSGQPESSPQDQKNDAQKQEQQQDNRDGKPPEQKPGESAFGDMNKKEEPPPPAPESTQKVGGGEKKEPGQEQVDPALALPTQKLDQLRNQDSPAQLFQMMEGERKPTKKNGKDW